MKKRANKISEKWIRQTRQLFRDFLADTDFPDPERNGERGPKFYYPEWLHFVEYQIMPSRPTPWTGERYTFFIPD